MTLLRPLLPALALACLPAIALAAPTPLTRESFEPNCIRNSREQGAPAAMTAPVCSCLWEKIQAEPKLDRTSTTAVSEYVQANVKPCVRQVLRQSTRPAP
jgi:hypothetical protein